MLADDSALFREGLRRVLADLAVDVLDAVATGPELLDRLADAQPEVVILDIRMPPTFTDEGLVTAARVRERYPAVAILMLSTYADSESAARLLAGGARGKGYLLKDRVDDPRTVRDVLYRLANGGTAVDPEVIADLVEHRRRSSEFALLTERERSVLKLMAEGRSNAGISGRLFVSAKTVETHVGAIFTKLGLPPSAAENRRVLAVLGWLRQQNGHAG